MNRGSPSFRLFRPVLVVLTVLALTALAAAAPVAAGGAGASRTKLSRRAGWRPEAAALLANGGGTGTSGVQPDDWLLAYFVDIQVGTPPQTSSVVLDTGSGPLGVAASNCATCGPALTHLYDAGKSTSAAPMKCAQTQDCMNVGCQYCWCDAASHTCAFHTGYVDGTGWDSVLIQDVVELAGIACSKTVVGAVYNSSIHHPPASEVGEEDDGTIGVAYGSLAPSGAGWLDACVAAGALKSDGFGVSLHLRGGELALGADVPSLHTGPLAFVAVNASLGFYSVSLTSVHLVFKQPTTKVGPAIPVPAAAQSAVVDTGASAMFLQDDLHDTIVADMLTACQQAPSPWVGVCDATAKAGNYWQSSFCVNVTYAQLSQWPDLLLSFDNGPVSVTVPSTTYMFPADVFQGQAATLWCRGISKSGGGTNLGDPFLRSTYAWFDRAGKRLGFAPQVASLE